VGSGKTTMLEVISELKQNDVLVVPEPVSEWQDVNGTDLLGEVVPYLFTKNKFCDDLRRCWPAIVAGAAPSSSIRLTRVIATI